MVFITRALTDRDAEIGRRVRVRRNMLGVTQSDLADALGVTFQQIQKYEKGQNRISVGALSHIAEVLEDTPIGYFFSQKNPFSELERDGEGGEPYLKADALRLLHAYMSIDDPKGRTYLLGLARAMAGKIDADEERKAA